MTEPTRDKSLVGAAGVHYVAAQLSLRGLVALPTIRNTSGVDIVTVNRSGSWFANLQVKTSRSRVNFWPVSTGYSAWTSPNNYYVFLRWLPKSEVFEVFLEPAVGVKANVDQAVAYERSRRNDKSWAPCFMLKDQADRLRGQWERFGVEEARS